MNDLRIVKKKYMEWSCKERTAISKLQVSNGGFRFWLMYDALSLDSFVAFHKGAPIAVLHVRRGNSLEAGVYVKPRYRRRGIGGKLLRRCARHYRGFKVYSHNDDTYRFFSAFESKKMQIERV